ncbi:MAG TPA: HEPN domain-containing protein [Xanthobacteraceae bacterium]|jgi:HEPN domain-containing protein|nr:HEPN domain-containing protein [Xanthobacteraceae bacterium]
MSGNDREKWDAQDLIQWQEARRWLAKADEDLRAANKLLPGVVNQAAFHVQQAMEKTLKALIVAKRQEIRKTHDILLLASIARPLWPELIPQPFPIVEISEWYMVSRYPGLEDIALSASDVTAALAWVSDFITVVRSQGPPDRP